MIEPMIPNIDILMELFHAEIIKFQMTTAYKKESPILEYIWDNLEHELVKAKLIERNYNE